MSSNLKKSLYLGLAALSFASIAGNSINNTNLSASAKAKKHVKKHKKHTRAKKLVHIKKLSNINNQDASTSAFTLKNGSLTNKPRGVKGAHTTTSGLSNNEMFMAYQIATLSNGKTYYKVVSFTDHAHRGFVSTNDVNTTSTYTPSENNQNTSAIFLSHPGEQSIFTYPAGSTFKNHTKVAPAQTATLANVPFGITQTAKIAATDKTAYYIVDLNDNNIQGWVNANAITSAPTRFFNASKDLKINFNDNENTVATQIVNVADLNDVARNAIGKSMYQNPTSNDRLLTNDFVKGLFTQPKDDGQGFDVLDADSKNVIQGLNVEDLTSSLAKIGYRVTNSDFNYSAQRFNNVKIGDTINIDVSKPAQSDNVTSKLNFKSITPNAQGQWNPASAKDISSDEVNFPQLNEAQKDYYNLHFSGNKDQFVNFNYAFNQNNLFSANDNNGVLATFDGAKQNTQITSAKQYTNGKQGVLAFNNFADVQAAAKNNKLGLNDSANSSRVTTLPIGRQFHYAYVYDATATSQYNAKATLNGQPITVIYDKVPVATPLPQVPTNNSGFTGYLAN